jgi:hypothetical protein
MPLPVLEHCVVPGAHVPEHAPKTHAWFPQAVGADHCPFVHVCTPLA